MEIILIGKQNIGDFIRFQQGIYENNPYYRDNPGRTIRQLLEGRSQICNGTYLQGVMVRQKGEILCGCILAQVDRMPEVLQLAYFESKNNPSAVATLMDYAKEIARKRGARELLLGLNIHVNYGLGFLFNEYQKPQSLGSAYNPSYYHDLIAPYASQVMDLVSYRAKMETLALNLAPRLLDKLQRDYSVKVADFKNIKETARIYNEINNAAFSDHKFYYPRREEEDLELFKEYRLFLKEENLLFLYHEEKPIGFMLWYPDLFQLLKPNEKLGPWSLIKSRLFPRSMDTFKVTEVGILAEYRNTGAVTALFEDCYQQTKNRYALCESGWILDCNGPSKGFGIKWGDAPSKTFKVYTVELEAGS